MSEETPALDGTRADVEPAAVFGREHELALLDRLLTHGWEHGESLVIHGEPGVGKSFMLAAARTRAAARGTRVRFVSGVECETDLAFAGLHLLMRPLLGGVRELPAPQREAVEVAFGIAQGPAPELFMIGLAVLTLLTESASRVPLVLIADDAQWLDHATLDVLAFVGRRLDADPIVLLAAVRDGFATPFDSAQLPRLELRGLDQTSARALLEMNAPELAPSVVERLLRTAEGNPLALVELPRALRSDRTGDGLEILEPVALTRRLQESFAARLAGIPSETMLMLLVAAVNDSDSIAETLAAAAVICGDHPPLDALEPARAANLVETETGRLRFRHPLVRSAIRHSADPVRRRQVHASLAEVLVDQADRRTWHLAAAAVGADETVAEMLEQVALRAASRGGLAVAAGALERAAALSTDGARRGGRLVRAAELALDVAPPEVVTRLVHEAEPLELSVVDRGRLTLIRELIGPAAPGEAGPVLPLIGTAERISADGHDRLALRLLWAAATSAFHSDGDPAARAQIVDACERLPVPDDDPLLLSTLALAAPIDQASAVIEGCLGWIADADADPDAMSMVGTALCTVGAAVLAHSFLTAAAGRMREAGRVRPLTRAIALRAMAGFLLGSWSAAGADGAEAAGFARETGQPVWGAMALSAQALLAGARGESQADLLASRAEQLALPIGARAALAMVQMARGLSALSTGRHDAAYHELRRMFDPTDPAYHSAKCSRGIGLLAEAAIHSGHREEARVLLAGLAPPAEQSGSPWQRVSARHARALLADDDDAEELFTAALAADLTRWPFDRARLQLAYGVWLRRQRRAADSRAPLRAAGDTFDALGAAPWSERTRQELRASGERSRRRDPLARDELSPQELQIAGMAADGLSNREIGERLYLSPRTVASHLYRAFPKLGITSRADLRAALAVESPEEQSDSRVG
jgi:DNA-binding CsgD family transcriptional regulator